MVTEYNQIINSVHACHMNVPPKPSTFQHMGLPLPLLPLPIGVSLPLPTTVMSVAGAGLQHNNIGQMNITATCVNLNMVYDSGNMKFEESSFLSESVLGMGHHSVSGLNVLPQGGFGFCTGHHLQQQQGQNLHVLQSQHMLNGNHAAPVAQPELQLDDRTNISQLLNMKNNMLLHADMPLGDGCFPHQNVDNSRAKHGHCSTDCVSIVFAPSCSSRRSGGVNNAMLNPVSASLANANNSSSPNDFLFLPTITKPVNDSQTLQQQPLPTFQPCKETSVPPGFHPLPMYHQKRHENLNMEHVMTREGRVVSKEFVREGVHSHSPMPSYVDNHADHQCNKVSAPPGFLPLPLYRDQHQQNLKVAQSTTREDRAVSQEFIQEELHQRLPMPSGVGRNTYQQCSEISGPPGFPSLPTCRQQEQKNMNMKYVTRGEGYIIIQEDVQESLHKHPSITSSIDKHAHQQSSKISVPPGFPPLPIYHQPGPRQQQQFSNMAYGTAPECCMVTEEFLQEEVHQYLPMGSSIDKQAHEQCNKISGPTGLTSLPNYTQQNQHNLMMTHDTIQDFGVFSQQFVQDELNKHPPITSAVGDHSMLNPLLSSLASSELSSLQQSLPLSADTRPTSHLQRSQKKSKAPQQQNNALPGPPGFPAVPNLPTEQYNTLPGPSEFAPLQFQCTDMRCPPGFSSQTQLQQRQSNVFPGPPGFSPLPALHQQGNALFEIVPKVHIVSAETTTVTAATAALVSDDNEDDDDCINEVDKHMDDVYEDEDVRIITSASDAITLDTHNKLEQDPESEFRTPPTTNVRMCIAMVEKAEAQARKNESSELQTPPIRPLLPSASLERSPLSPWSRVVPPRGVNAEVEIDNLDIALSPQSTAHVAYSESMLLQATNNSFHPSVKWTSAILSQVLTFEIESMCMNGAAGLAMLRRQKQFKVEENERHLWNGETVGQPCMQLFMTSREQQRQYSSNHLPCTVSSLSFMSSSYIVQQGQSQKVAMGNNAVMTGQSWTSNSLTDTNVGASEQHQQEQWFSCFIMPAKQALRLSSYIERLVSYANCSFSAFIVMLIYVNRVQQRCKYLQLNDLNVDRVVLAALLAAAKFVEDRVYSNADFALIGGVDVQELNDIEFKFNQAANWTFFVAEDEFKAFENGMIERWTAKNAEGELVAMTTPYVGVEGSSTVGIQ